MRRYRAGLGADPTLPDQWWCKRCTKDGVRKKALAMAVAVETEEGKMGG